MQGLGKTAWFAALLVSAGLGIGPMPVYGQIDLPADATPCDQLRARATAVHQESASMSNTEDILALAVGMETLDVALEEIARDYARLDCRHATQDEGTDD